MNLIYTKWLNNTRIILKKLRKMGMAKVLFEEYLPGELVVAEVVYKKA